MPQRLANHPLVLALLAAVQRLTEIPAAGWVWGILVSCVSAVVHDVFTGIYLFAGAFTILDLRWGALVAIENGRRDPDHPNRYDAARRRRGLHAKIITLALLLGLRGVEAWATSWGFLDVAGVLNGLGLTAIAARVSAAGGGVLAAMITSGVWFEEAQSWEAHRRALGGGPIPLWSTVLQLGRAANARIAAAAKPGLE